MSNQSVKQLLAEGRAVSFVEGESVLLAMLRAGYEFGGCLCLAGDCPHCLTTIDGTSYTRSCRVRAREGMRVERQRIDVPPPLPAIESLGEPVVARHLFADIVVIGQGLAGREAAARARAAGRDVITLDAADGQEVIGIYPGPLVAARTEEGMLHVHPRGSDGEIIVATGAMEIHPVAPGNHLAGIVTRRAAEQLAAAGIDLGRVVAIGEPPETVAVERLEGELVRFEDGGSGRVAAVVVRGDDGEERRVDCETVVVGLGRQPRDVLARMGAGLRVSVVGEAAGPAVVPPAPREGLVCHCSGVTVSDLAAVVDHGFEELELVKRATLAGTGTCQGAVCLPHVRGFLAERCGAVQPPFTARPVTRQPTMGEVAAGAFHQPTPRTALDDQHRRLGARMERMGGWWRPWNYGDTLAEYTAVREAVSIGDVSTLGKIVVAGPDAPELVDRLYPTRVETLAAGRLRYALLLDDRGYVVDDGMICRDDQTRFLLTFTSGGATFAELWVRDWAESFGLDVRIMNRTMSLGAINLTGPRAKELLARAGLSDPPGYLHHATASVAGIDCRVLRLSFTGEVSFELHHAAADSVALWQRLMELGADLGIRPHGLEALLRLRLEKGHLIVGQDTDFDSTPRRLAHEWAVRLDKADFVGRQAVLRTNRLPLDRQLVGLAMCGEAPPEGAVIRHRGEYAGYVTSSAWSPVLGKSVMLGWLCLVDGELPPSVTIDGREALRVPTPFYDPEGSRARA